jgi:1,4-dihydroxy-2-naphthoate octaprenyltransferase
LSRVNEILVWELYNKGVIIVALYIVGQIPLTESGLCGIVRGLYIGLGGICMVATISSATKRWLSPHFAQYFYYGDKLHLIKEIKQKKCTIENMGNMTKEKILKENKK